LLSLAQQQSPAGVQTIDPVVFVIKIKENRTYNHIFGTPNSAYGSKRCALSTGRVPPMGRAADRYAHDIDHKFFGSCAGHGRGQDETVRPH
jgi:hypothetical protein